jgi:hypothetical protein
MSDVPVSTAGEGVPNHASEFISIGTIRTLLAGLLVASFALVVLGVFRQAVNGDEYIFLSTIYRVANGEPLGLLQTAYAHLFAWLPSVGHNEISQTALGRLVHVIFWAASLALLYRLGRKLLDPIGALATVALFAVFSYSIGNATSFRIDALLLPVLLGVAILLLNPTTGRVAAAGALSGLAVALTIKAVLWAPAFIGLLAVGLWHSQNRLRPILAGAVAGTVTFAGIMLIHARLISMAPSDLPETVGRGSANAGRYMLFNGFVPQWEFLRNAVLANPATCILLIIGIGLAVIGLRQSEHRRSSLILLLLAMPILSVTFYTNAFPYAYLTLMPTACLLAGYAFSEFAGSGERAGRLAVLLFSGVAAVPMVHVALEYRSDAQQQQRQVVAEVHRLFSQPVPYLDGGGMLASFPGSGMNMTWFGIDTYRRSGSPAVTNYIHRDKPPLLIVNTTSLKVWDAEQPVSPELRLLPQDEETIRATYAHYWDQIWLAGRQWRDLAAGESRVFEIVVPGDHTLIAGGPVIVDGRTYQPWTTIPLEEGPHELRTTSAEPDLRILWGTRLKRLEDLPPSLAGAEQ